MTFSFYTPRAPLSRHIACLWFQSGQAYLTRERLLPTGTIELMINLGPAQKVVDPRDPARLHLYTTSWLAGLQTKPVTIEPVAQTQILGIRFKPGGAYPFFDFPISEANDRIVDLDLIWNHAHLIRERLFETPALSDRFRLLEEVLLQRLRPTPHELRTVQFAVDEIACLDRFTTVRALSDSAGVSQKHLISLFNKIVGVPPKVLQRILRFNHALGSLDPARPVHWAEVAQGSYYYDQAHFDKDFLAFSGFTPTTYLQLKRGSPGAGPGSTNDANMVPVEPVKFLQD